MKAMRRLTYFILLIVASAANSMAENFSSDELARRTIERRAVEAVIWGMPAVNFDLMYQAMVREPKAAANQIVYWSRLPDWKNQTLTPNPDTIYFMPFYQHEGRGPVVLEIPPADEGSITGSVDGLLADAPWRTSAQPVWTRVRAASTSSCLPEYKDKRARRLHPPAVGHLSEAMRSCARI